jgi:hypothetical protein
MIKISRALAALGLVCAVGGANAAPVYPEATYYFNFNPQILSTPGSYVTPYWIQGGDWVMDAAIRYKVYGDQSKNNLLSQIEYLSIDGWDVDGLDNGQLQPYQVGKLQSAEILDGDFSISLYQFFGAPLVQVDGMRALLVDGNGLVTTIDASVNPVPIPAAAWLMLSGIGALGAAARRRKTLALQP